MTEEQSTAGAEAAVPTAASDSASVPANDVASARERVGVGGGVTAASQEVRFATAMTGGVSLAIWMGGVARELNLLDQASRLRELEGSDYQAPGLSNEDTRVRSLYLRLLDLLDQVVRIDVLSGTSAGGINAALLGLCHARGVDLGLLRGMWFDAGAFETLLRNPTDKAPPSLLQGDGVLLAEMQKAVGQLTSQQSAPSPHETTVYVTTTLLTGETSRFTDAYGTVVPDVDHLGLFTFSTSALTNMGQHAFDALALAARSSASFPAAFEPAFLPFRTTAAATVGPAERPAMERFANITRPHWVADGGLLANRPLAPMLEAIFARPADDRQVRRVLLYIVPDPGGTPDPRLTPDRESIDKPFTLGQALVHDLGACLNQSISAELTEIRRHNDRVDAMRDTRLRLAELGTTGTQFPTEAARADFAVRQSEALARLVVDRLMRALSTKDLQDLPAAWQPELAPGASIEEECRREIRRRLDDETWSVAPQGGDYEALARFGRSAFDGAKAVVITLIRTGFMLAASGDDRAELARLGKRIHAAFTPEGSLDLDNTVRKILDTQMATTPVPSLTELARTLAELYAADRNEGANEYLDADLNPVDYHDRAPKGLALGWWILSDLLDEASTMMHRLIEQTRRPPVPAHEQQAGRPSREHHRARAADRLATYLAYLGDGRDHVASQLLNLHIAERSMLPVDIDVEQPVELVQVSANTRTLLDPGRATASDKLTGMQLHHFGAFYKRSWRANDWMWGRLDGAGWLVHVLLDPRRVVAVVDTDPATYPPGHRAESFVRALEALPRDLSQVAVDETVTRDAVKAELAFLDSDDLPIPASLPTTSLWLSAAWQQEIVNAELPVVATETLATPSKRDSTWALEVVQLAGKEREVIAAARQAVAAVSAGRSTRRARSTIDHAETRPDRVPVDRTALAKHLPTCPVPGETLSRERGEPLFARTVTKSAAVATAAITSVKRSPASLAPVLATARTVTLTGYRAVDVTAAVPKRLIVIGIVAAATGVFLAVQHSTLLGVTGTVLLLVGLYMIALGAWGLSQRLLYALAATTVVTGVVALCLPWTREWAFGTSEKDQGWLATTLEPWLRSSWWSILVVLAIILALGALCGYVAQRITESANANHRS